jgi:hypothetical protein
MPAQCPGSCALSAVVIADPQLRAIALCSQDVPSAPPSSMQHDRRSSGFVFGFAEMPKPGSDGQTTCNASAALPPCAVGFRQWLDHLVKLDHRTRPAMRDEQRHRARIRRADVAGMNVEPVDCGGELRKAIEPRLASAPIIITADILIHFSGAPRLQSSTRSASGQRVLHRRDLGSWSTSWPIEMIGFDFGAHEGQAETDRRTQGRYQERRRRMLTSTNFTRRRHHRYRVAILRRQ